MNEIINTLCDAIKAICNRLHKWWVESDRKWREQQTAIMQANQAGKLIHDMNFIQEYLFRYLHKANLDTIKPLTDATNIIIHDEISNPYSNKYVFEVAKENIPLTQTRKNNLLRTMQFTIRNVDYKYFNTYPDTGFITITHIEDYGVYLLIYVSIKQ